MSNENSLSFLHWLFRKVYGDKTLALAAALKTALACQASLVPFLLKKTPIVKKVDPFRVTTISSNVSSFGSISVREENIRLP